MDFRRPHTRSGDRPFILAQRELFSTGAKPGERLIRPQKVVAAGTISPPQGN